MPATTLRDRRAPLARALGELCIGFAYCETALGCAVGFLANPDEPRTGHILVAELSFRARLAAFEALYPERAAGSPHGAAPEDLESFRSQAHALESERNKLVHSLYRPGRVGDPGVRRIKTTAKGHKGLKLQFEDLQPASVQQQAELAFRLPCFLDELMLKIPGYPEYQGRFYAVFEKQAASDAPPLTPATRSAPSRAR